MPEGGPYPTVLNTRNRSHRLARRFPEPHASSLNSLVKRCRFAIGHLPRAIVPLFRCPRKWGSLIVFFNYSPIIFDARRTDLAAVSRSQS